jgi:hypothetical protein
MQRSEPTFRICFACNAPAANRNRKSFKFPVTEIDNVKQPVDAARNGSPRKGWALLDRSAALNSPSTNSAALKDSASARLARCLPRTL